jgi:uncharacterized membrane protein
MSTHSHTLDVNCPIHTVYLQWTRFESFPAFMEGVRSVQQTDDRHARWEIETSSDHRVFETTITRQEPDRALAWASTDGSWQAGQVTLHPLAEDATRVTLALDFRPQGFSEALGDRLGFVARRLEGDLERFKELVEGACPA